MSSDPFEIFANDTTYTTETNDTNDTNDVKKKRGYLLCTAIQEIFSVIPIGTHYSEDLKKIFETYNSILQGRPTLESKSKIQIKSSAQQQLYKLTYFKAFGIDQINDDIVETIKNWNIERGDVKIFNKLDKKKKKHDTSGCLTIEQFK